MGVDLDFLIPKWPDQDELFVCAEMQLDRNGPLFEAIEALPSESAGTVLCYHDRTADDAETFGRVTHDPYGNPLRRVRAGDLATLAEHGKKETLTSCAFAYVRGLPPGWPVVLWWH